MFVKYQKAVCLSAVLALAATFASANAGTISEPVAKIHGTIFQSSGVDPDSSPQSRNPHIEVGSEQDSCDVITTVDREALLQGESRPTLQVYEATTRR